MGDIGFVAHDMALLGSVRLSGSWTANSLWERRSNDEAAGKAKNESDTESGIHLECD